MAPPEIDMNNLTGPQKAATFLLIMGQEYTTQVFKNLAEEEIRKLVSHMSEIKYIPPEVTRQVMEEFVRSLESNNPLMVEGSTFLKTIMKGSLAKDKANAISKELEKRKKNVPFGYLEEIDTAALVGLIKDEYPQTIALILAHLRPARAAEVLNGLPKEVQGDVAMRIAEINRVPMEIIDEVDETLQKELAGRADSASTRAIGGVSALADILNEVDRDTEESVLSAIEEQREEMAEEIRQLMFVFEDLIKVDDRGMREILKQVETSQLSLALKTASEEMKEKIFGNLSERAAGMLREDMEVMGPVRLTEVEKAQQMIIRVARDLEGEGKIVLAKGKEDTLV
jgi:flagellar motor switch protein FliG